MRYFPLYLQLKDSTCVIVGGGEVALRKARLLVRSGTAVRLIAPELHPSLADFALEHSIEHVAETFNEVHLEPGTKLVVAATNNRETNQSIAHAASAAGIFCNVVDDRELSTAIMPAIVDRSPLIISVSSGGESPVMTTRIRQQLEQLFPPSFGKLTEFAGNWRKRVSEKLSNNNERRRFWQKTLEGEIARRVLSGDEQAAAAILQQKLEQIGPDLSSGFAWIIGAGPGDPELLTLKAARALARADVIMHDRLVSPEILDMARRDAEFISVGKTAGRKSISQQDINALLVEKVSAGLEVCRLKGGDPFIFGRGGEEIEALQDARLHWQVVPGITAANGCAANASLPLTHRNVSRSVMFITASTAENAEHDWEAISKAADTIVFYMGVNKLEYISNGLRKAGKANEHPVLLIENGTTDRERMIRGTLSDICSLADAAGIVSPAIIIIGEVTELANLSQEAFERQPQHKWAQAAGS
ncbi:MAG: siroheme synthase CysG [Gammaproteobacteria bacterium]